MDSQTNDWDLLRKYIKDNDNKAFDLLASRHIALVRAVATSRTRDAERAEDITVAVFLLLAEKARSIRQGTVLAGWLYKSANLIALNEIRAERRRKAHESEAVAETQHLQREKDNDMPDYGTMMLLSDGMMKLNEPERNAVLLRYAEGLSADEAASTLHTTPDAVKKRAQRGIERLRRHCLAKGMTINAAAIAIVIETKEAKAASVEFHLEDAQTSAQNTPNSSISLLVKGAIKAMMISQIKLSACLITVAATVGISG